MTADELHQQVSALLGGGADLSAQFADVEAKLARWVAGVQAAQAALARAPTEATPGDAAVADAEPQTTAPAQPAPAAPTPAPADEPEEPRRASKLFSGQSPVLPAAAPPTRRSKGAAPAGPGTDDEALLAGLPPQVANAVRIKRRLGNRKPLRELLAEINLEPPAPEPDVKKRTWWRRGND
jgi:hypothetical protein